MSQQACQGVVEMRREAGKKPGHVVSVHSAAVTSVITLSFKLQEGPDAEIIGGKRSVFYLLMKMFVTSGHSQLKSSTKLLIVKVSLFYTSSWFWKHFA